MRNVYPIIPLLLVTLLFACERPGIQGNGIMAEEVRDITAFTELSVSGAFSINLIVGDTAGLTLSAEENLIPLILTLNRGEQLIIEPTQKISPGMTIQIDLRTPALTRISSSGSNCTVVEGIDSERLDVNLAGADSLFLSGKTDELDIELAGAGSIRAMELKANETSVTLTGAGTADVYAAERLDARVIGVGIIDYYGNPKEVDSSIAGVGTINRKE